MSAVLVSRYGHGTKGCSEGEGDGADCGEASERIYAV